MGAEQGLGPGSAEGAHSPCTFSTLREELQPRGSAGCGREAVARSAAGPRWKLRPAGSGEHHVILSPGARPLPDGSCAGAAGGVRGEGSRSSAELSAFPRLARAAALSVGWR